jgi:DNA-binding PadR family transcriptional regulator
MIQRPMSEQAFLVLTVLAAGPKHGYAIMQAAEALDPPQPTLPVATLYGLLDRLVADGLVEVDREEIHRGRLRRYYRITPEGLGALAAAADRIAANVRAARRVLRSARLHPSPSKGAL